MSQLEKDLLTRSVHEEDDFGSLIAQSCFDGILGWDCDAQVTLWNPALEQMTGIGREQAMNRSVGDVLPCLKSSGADLELYRTLRGETLVNRQVPYDVPSTQNQGVWEAALFPVYGEDRQVSGGIAILREQTPRTEATRKPMIQNRPPSKNQSFRIRLGYAWNGIAHAARSERSFQTHLTLGLAAIVLSAMLGFRPLWWGLIALTIGLVLALELVNTALEALADRVHPERHPEIQITKDCAAGAVGVASLTSLVVILCALWDRFGNSPF